MSTAIFALVTRPFSQMFTPAQNATRPASTRSFAARSRSEIYLTPNSSSITSRHGNVRPRVEAQGVERHHWRYRPENHQTFPFWQEITSRTKCAIYYSLL